MSTTYDVNGKIISAPGACLSSGPKPAPKPAAGIYDSDDSGDEIISDDIISAAPISKGYSPIKSSTGKKLSSPTLGMRNDSETVLQPARKDYFAYKGFKKSEEGKLRCRDTFYTPGEIYVIDGPIQLCYSGFHYCDNLNDVFTYYDMEDRENVFHKIQVLGQYSQDAEDDKRVTSSFKILEEIPYQEIVFAALGEKLKKIIALQQLYPKMYLTGSIALMLAGKIPFRKPKDINFVSPELLEIKDHYISGYGKGFEFAFGEEKIEEAVIDSGEELTIDTRNSYSFSDGEELTIDTRNGYKSGYLKCNPKEVHINFIVFVEPRVRFKKLRIPYLDNQTINIQLPEDIMKVKAKLYFTDGVKSHKKDLLHYLIHN